MWFARTWRLLLIFLPRSFPDHICLLCPNYSLDLVAPGNPSPHFLGLLSGSDMVFPGSQLTSPQSPSKHTPAGTSTPGLECSKLRVAFTTSVKSSRHHFI